MRNRAVLFLALGMIAAGYFVFPILIPPVSYLSLEVENLRISQDRIWLNFTVVIRNRSIWPLALNETHLRFGDLEGRPIAGFPSSLNLLPVQTVEIKGFGTYVSDSYFVSSCCPGVEVRRLWVNLDGYEIPMLHMLGLRHQTRFSIPATADLP